MKLEPTYLTANASELWMVAPGFVDLLLTGVTVDSDGNQFQIMAQAEDATWGEPVPIDVTVQRWMTDGAVASTQGHENREMSFRVVISAPTSTELAAGEAALARRAGSCLLYWIPSQGDGIAPTSVFEVWTWHLNPDFDTDRENRLARAYEVRLTAKPWVRSKDLTSVNAVTISTSPTVTPIDTCTSTTNWTSNAGTPTTSGGAVKETVNVNLNFNFNLKRTATVSGLGATPYLQIDATLSGAQTTGLAIAVAIDSVTLSKVAQIGTVGYYQIPSGTTSFNVLTVTGSGTATVALPGSTAVTLSVADVSATDTVGGLSTLKQLTRSLDVGGSVPTSGSLKVASPSATVLGTVLVHTYPAGGASSYSPPLRQYRSAGFSTTTVTADSTCASGAHETFVNAGASAGTAAYTLPQQSIPEGTYAVVGRFIFGSAATMTVTVASGSNNYTTTQVAQGPVTASGAGAKWGVIGTLSLPPQDLPAESTTTIYITATATATTGTHTLDEFYLLDMTHGAVTLVQTGSSPAFTRLWIDSPDVNQTKNRPAVYIGTWDDRSDAAAPYYADVLSLGDHDFDPEGMTVFTVTDGVDRSAVSASFYRRWHTNAGA